MFSTPRPDTISSDEGFSVRHLGRTGVEYREGGKEMFIDSELGYGTSGAGISIFVESITAWLAPHDALEISENERRRIVTNVRRAYEWAGMEVDLGPEKS